MNIFLIVLGALGWLACGYATLGASVRLGIFPDILSEYHSHERAGVMIFWPVVVAIVLMSMLLFYPVTWLGMLHVKVVHLVCGKPLEPETEDHVESYQDWVRNKTSEEAER